jgi:hypothetical protein
VPPPTKSDFTVSTCPESKYVHRIEYGFVASFQAVNVEDGTPLEHHDESHMIVHEFTKRFCPSYW